MTACARELCMLDATGVGKASLVRRFVEGFFAERCLTTIGVTIDRKPVTVGDDEVHMEQVRADQWALDPAEIAALASEGWPILRTSAATGLGVEDAFRHVASRLLPGQP